MKPIYLDYAASTPMDSRVLQVMRPYFLSKYGNPGSLHRFGQEAIAAVDRARETIANALHAEFREVIFTASATEANNLALRGAVKYFMGVYKNVLPRIIVSAVEHESVLHTAKDLERDGVEVIYIPVNHEGIVDVERIRSFLNERTVMVSVMYVNNEIGTEEPIQEVLDCVKEFRERLPREAASLSVDFRMKDHVWPLVHTDAAQAFQFFECFTDEIKVDFMTLSAQKIYGPKGVGVLYARSLKIPGENKNGYALTPFITGGGQEFGLRSATENVPLIVGCAKAVALAVSLRKKEARRIAELKQAFWKGLERLAPQVILNSSGGAPHILNVYFPNILAEELLIKLDIAGIAVSSGAACRARSNMPSYTLKALGFGEDRQKSSIRFSFGKPTTQLHIKEALTKLKLIFAKSI